MIEKLGYPKSLIAIEKGMRAFGFSDTARRVDILCFWRGKNGLKPLLLIECKVDTPGREAKEQLLGYNQEIKAPFLALASQDGVQMFWYEEGKWVAVPFLPFFSELVSNLENPCTYLRPDLPDEQSAERDSNLQQVVEREHEVRRDKDGSNMTADFRD